MKRRILKETKVLNSNNAEDVIYNYETKHKQGYTPQEIKSFLEKYSIDEDAFYKNLGVNTCMITDGDVITYHCDILKGVLMTIEERGQMPWEFD
jgi:hypothetical protein